MKIINVKINGIENPIGFSYDYILCSWNVIGTESIKQSHVVIEVSYHRNFKDVLYKKEGKDLRQSGEPLDITLKPRTTYYFRITVTGNMNDRAVSDIYTFETGKINEKWKADWITTNKKDTFLPVFTKKFSVNKKVSRARLYISGLGLFEAWLNGKKIGNEYLTPYLTDYESRIQVITFPIEELLKEENKLEIMTSHGWFMGWFGLGNTDKNFGDRMAVIGELYLEYEDGTTECILTDKTWNYCGSDIEEAGIYIGEVYNRLLWDGKENEKRPVVVLEDNDREESKNINKLHLKDRLSLPVIIKEKIKVAQVIHSPAGEIILDMGQNFAGFISFYADFPKGTKIVLEFGETLQYGNFYNENYREARPQFTYISNGKPEYVQAHFTYYGLRYVKVTGWVGEIDPLLFTGEVLYSDLSRTGYFETSDKKVNRLYENSLWGLKSNFLDVPTDCPQRNEKLGWTADTQVFAPTASYHMDTRAFYHKFIRDLRDEQKKLNGGVPNFFPNIGKKTDCSSVWGDIATLLPNTLYQFYGNREEMEYTYSLMKDWVDYIHRLDRENGGKNLYAFGFHFGDWLALDGVTENSFKGSTDDYYIASVYYFRSAQITSEIATLLDKNQDAKHYKELADNIREAILKEYFTPSGRLAIDTQTAYVIALKYGIYIDKEKIIGQFRERLKKDCYKIKCGFVGAPLLCTVLAENNMVDIAYDFLLKEEFPSWLYCVNLGATTMWERWNSLLPDGTINPAGMNSLNHYAYGSVMEFVYTYIGGILSLEPGFSKVKIAPHPDIRLGHSNCSYNSVNGRYVCNWKIQDSGQLYVYVEVPFSCTAELELPLYKGGIKHLEPGIYEFTYMPEKDYRKAYSLSTTISRIRKDERAIEILRRNVPVFAGMAAGEDIEFGANSLSELAKMHYIPHDSKKLQKAIEEICELVYL